MKNRIDTLVSNPHVRGYKRLAAHLRRLLRKYGKLCPATTTFFDYAEAHGDPRLLARVEAISGDPFRELTVEARNGHGHAFTLWLTIPLAPAPPAAPAQAVRGDTTTVPLRELAALWLAACRRPARPRRATVTVRTSPFAANPSGIYLPNHAQAPLA